MRRQRFVKGHKNFFGRLCTTNPHDRSRAASTDPNRCQSAFARLTTIIGYRIENSFGCCCQEDIFPPCNGENINSPSRRRLSLISTASRPVYRNTPARCSERPPQTGVHQDNLLSGYPKPPNVRISMRWLQYAVFISIPCASAE